MELFWEMLLAKLKKLIRNGILRCSFGKKKKKRKHLLVLDLNGLLVDVVDKAPKDYTPDIRIKRKAVFKRPFCDDFLKFCFENFDVGVWSSRMKKNMDGLVDFLFGDMKHQVLFFWDQSQCTEPGLRIGQLGFQTTENKKKPLYLKELKKIWKKHDASLPWEDGVYNESNTLLLDDSPYKAILNPLHNAMFPKSYRFQHKDDNSLGPGGDIRVYLEGLVMAENIQEYVEQHPFGQAPIASSSDLYRRMIDITKNSELTDKRGSSNHNQLFMSGLELKNEVRRVRPRVWDQAHRYYNRSKASEAIPTLPMVSEASTTPIWEPASSLTTSGMSQSRTCNLILKESWVDFVFE